MCTSDCPCFRGSSGSTKAKWNALGEDAFNAFNRTSTEKRKDVVSTDGTSYPIYPLKWTNNETLAKKNWKQCFEDVFKDGNYGKYGPVVYFDQKREAPVPNPYRP